MHLITAVGNSDFLLAGLTKLFKEGKKIERRDQASLELEDVVIQLSEPSFRVLDLQDRRDCLAATMFEACWVLFGENYISSLKVYLPRAEDFSDNGKAWRAAYGPRIRAFPIGDIMKTDQLLEVANLLAHNPLSRQAFILIAHPADLTARGHTKDLPCNLALHVLLEPDEWNGGQPNFLLSLKIFQRSMDILWGSNVNLFTWSLLMEVLSDMIMREDPTRTMKVRPHKYTHFVSCLHLYERHWKRAKNLLEKNGMPVGGLWFPAALREFGGSTSPLCLSDVERLHNVGSAMAQGDGGVPDCPNPLTPVDIESIFPAQLYDWVSVFQIHQLLRRGGENAAVQELLAGIRSPVIKTNQTHYVDWTNTRSVSDVPEQ